MLSSDYLEKYNISGEFRFLLACLKSRIVSNSDFIKSELERGKIDWQSFVPLTAYHKVISLVYQSLNQYGWGSIPEQVHQDLRIRNKNNAKRVLLLTSELVKIIRLLKENNIPTISLKGPILSMQLYGNLTNRSGGDLDILIYPESLDDVDALLLDNGYKRKFPPIKLTSKKIKYFMRSTNHFSYIHRQQKISVEPHWRFDPNPNADANCSKEIWQTRRWIQIVGTDVSVLSEKMTLLYLTIHGSKHAWEKLQWLSDFAELIRKNRTRDWDSVLSKAREYKAQRPLFQAFFLSQILLCTPVPDCVQKSAKKDRALQAIVKMSLFFIKESRSFFHFRPFTYGYLLRKLYESKFQPSLRFKFVYWSRIIFFLSGDISRIELPDWAFSLYFLLKPLFWFEIWFLPKFLKKRNRTASDSDKSLPN